jgi:hypothetical protein
MAISFSKIKNKFRRMFTTHINPHRYWILLLRMFLIACILLTVGDFYLLYQIKTEQIFQIKKTSDSAGMINAALLQSVQDSLNQKAQTQATVQQNPPMFQDPSM